MPRGNSIAAHIPEGYLTTGGVADAIGVSKDAVKGWRKAGVFPPDEEVRRGKVTIPIYKVDRLRLARALKDGLGTILERADYFHDEENEEGDEISTG